MDAGPVFHNHKCFAKGQIKEGGKGKNEHSDHVRGHTTNGNQAGLPPVDTLLCSCMTHYRAFPWTTH